MGLAVLPRSLIARFLYRGKILAWQCSACKKLFCRTVDEIERDRRNSLPEHIECEFQKHSCLLVLVADSELRRQLQAVVEMIPQRP